MGDTGKADMPSGRLAFATRRVDLMAAGMRAPLALCADGMTILPPPPHEAWEKLDQMVVRVQGAPERGLVRIGPRIYLPTASGSRKPSLSRGIQAEPSLNITTNPTMPSQYNDITISSTI